jgi:pantoate--beta-alanine ligase
MGYLHEGHLSLVRRARTENGAVVVSIFVNPTQFGPQEDFDRYPRDEERDLSLLAAEGADAVFIPTASEMYPDGFNTWVEVKGPLVERLEGASRPGHFRGVTTVVAKLFSIVQPQRAYFGEKDAQQLRVIAKMVADLNLPVEIVACPTVREGDGLAMSSRNAYLSPEERRAALVVPGCLDLAQEIIRGQGLRDVGLVRESLRVYIGQKPQVEIDYVSVADAETLAELEVIDRPALVSVAVRVGRTRLIDNLTVVPEDRAGEGVQKIDEEIGHGEKAADPGH